jgi:hypothetical protein
MMTAEDRLLAAVQGVIDRKGDQSELSPAWIATETMDVIGFPRQLHELGYIGCHLALRQIARGKLRRQFDPVDIAESDDLFPETLQDRYPRRPRRGQEPLYVLRDDMSDDDVSYNVARMRRAASGLLRHADALEAWGLERKEAA